MSQVMRSSEANLLGGVHGGVIMRIVDDTAGVVANRFAEGPAVTAVMDEMTFLVPVKVGEILHAQAQVNWVGETSLEVGVRVEAEPCGEIRPRVHVASAYLLMVAVDENGDPRPVRPLTLATPTDRRRHREAEIRRDHRLSRRRQILQLREHEDRSS